MQSCVRQHLRPFFWPTGSIWWCHTRCGCRPGRHARPRKTGFGDLMLNSGRIMRICRPHPFLCTFVQCLVAECRRQEVAGDLSRRFVRLFVTVKRTKCILWSSLKPFWRKSTPNAKQRHRQPTGFITLGINPIRRFALKWLGNVRNKYRKAHQLVELCEPREHSTALDDR